MQCCGIYLLQQSCPYFLKINIILPLGALFFSSQKESYLREQCEHILQERETKIMVRYSYRSCRICIRQEGSRMGPCGLQICPPGLAGVHNYSYWMVQVWHQERQQALEISGSRTLLATARFQRTVSISYFTHPSTFLLIEPHPYLTPSIMRGRSVSLTSFLLLDPIIFQLPRNFIPLMIPFPLSLQLFPPTFLLFNLHACSDLTLKQTLTLAHLHYFAWLTPSCLSISVHMQPPL